VYFLHGGKIRRRRKLRKNNRHCVRTAV
jgi:hypothetical protein